jgi:hypothetical protein
VASLLREISGLIRWVASLLREISGLIRWVASLHGDNLLVFYYLSEFEIRPYKMGGLSFKGDN